MTQRAMTIWTFVAAAVAVFMVSLDNLVVTTALPVIKRDLGAGLSGLEWTVNAYTLTFAVLLMTGAGLGDRFGRKRMFLVGLAVFTFGSAMAAIAPSIDSAKAAAQGLTLPDNMEIVITNSPGADAYPIAGFTWLLLYQNQTDKTKAISIGHLANWILTDAQQYTTPNNYVPLSDDAKAKALAELATVTYQGTPIAELQ